MDNDQKSPLEQRFEEDIERIDEITMLVANILFELEKDLYYETFDIDTFQEKIESQFELDETRKLLFRRAIEKYNRAIEYTKQDPEIISSFLKKTKLQLDKYDGIEAYVDPKRPGVIVIKIQSRADAVQLHNDVRSEQELRVAEIASSFNANFNVVQQTAGAFGGKSVSLDHLGVKDVPVLGVIVVCQDQGDQERSEKILQHEYAHAIYESLVVPVIHKYYSGVVDGKKHSSFGKINRFSATTKASLLDELGNISTDKRDKMLKEQALPVVPQDDDDFGDVFRLPKSELTPEQQIDNENAHTLAAERYLLNELRSYGLSDPLIEPNERTTSLEMRAPKYVGDIAAIDPQMAQRYLTVHSKVLSAHLHDLGIHMRVLSILAAAQTLSQADRLIDLVLEANKDLPFHSWQDFVQCVKFLLAYSEGRLDGIFDYTIGNVSLSKADVIKQLLPDRALFNETVARFYGENVPAPVVKCQQLY